MMMRDRREFGRKAVNFHGWVRVAGRPPVACIVRDISVKGARIELPEFVWIPYDFTLVVEPIGLRVLCETKNKYDRYIGVLFAHGQHAEDVEEAPRSVAQSANIVREWRGGAAQREPRILSRFLMSAG